MCSAASQPSTPLSNLSAGEDAAIRALLSASMAAHHECEERKAVDISSHTSPGVPPDHLSESSMISREPTPPPRPTNAVLAWNAPLPRPFKATHVRGVDAIAAGYVAPSSVLGKRPPNGSMRSGGARLATAVPLPTFSDQTAAAAVMAAMASKTKVHTKRARYDDDFKEQVVREAMSCPEGARIKPTCSRYPGVEPCQVPATCPLRT